MTLPSTTQPEISKPTVSSTILAPKLAFALSHGVPVEDLDAVAGISISEVIGSESRISEELPARVISGLYQSRYFRAPTLQIAQSTPFWYFNGLEKAVQFAPNGLLALDALNKYGRLLAERTTTWIDETTNFMSFHFSHPADATNDGLMQEIGMALRLRLLRDVIGPGALLGEVGFGFSKHARLADYQETFGAIPRFNRSSGDAVLVFKKSDLSVPNPSRNGVLYAAGCVYLEEVLKTLNLEDNPKDVPSLSQAASACIERGEFDAAAVAAEAGISLRMAQRTAAARRTTIRNLISEARLHKAKALVLADLKVPFDVVAEKTGYSDDRAFRRFFKRATGLSPSEYRTLFQRR
ncbi:MAG: helix-turn-helix domain-containing protein [Pseudomonadota bacterium]